MTPSRLALAALALLALAACHEAPSPDEARTSDEAQGADEVTSATRYRDVISLLGEGDLNAYLAWRTQLAQQFDEICGDTFCGGDFSDLGPVQLTCSATEKTTKMRECLWTFGGSYGAVEGATGAFEVVAKTFSCRFAVGVKASLFLDTMAASDDPLHEPIPGRDASVYDALFGCFTSTDPLPAGAPGRFVDAIEGLGDDDRLRFVATRHALSARFDEVCGDSFCEGEFSSFAPLGLRCSVDPATGELGACVWAFAAASPNVAASTGRVSHDRAAFTCPLPVSGTMTDLLTALEDADDPLFTPLPGAGASINDALIDCL